VSVSAETLCLESPDRPPVEIAVRSLDHVVVHGRARITLPAVLTVTGLGIPVFFCRRNGLLYAALESRDDDLSLWEDQRRAGSDESFRVRFAREVVAAKLHNSAALLVRFDLPGG